jgi:hypothetical protein
MALFNPIVQLCGFDCIAQFFCLQFQYEVEMHPKVPTIAE